MGVGNEIPPPPTSSTSLPQPSNKVKEITVFLTGFGPFPDGKGGQYTQNASHLITRLLPSHLPIHHSSNPSGAHIKLLNPTAADDAHIKVEYAYIRDYVRKLHDEHGLGERVDLFVHLGQAAGWGFVSVERRAYAQGMRSVWWGEREREEGYYLIPDNAGMTVRDAGANPWGKVPMGLATAVDVDSVVRDANEALAGLGKDDGGEEGAEVLEVRAHHEGGSYGCGFIYYESLANCYVRGRKADVLFCHVPGETDEVSVRRGRDAIVAIIGAAVVELLKRREKEVNGLDEKIEKDGQQL